MERTSLQRNEKMNIMDWRRKVPEKKEKMEKNNLTDRKNITISIGRSKKTGHMG